MFSLDSLFPASVPYPIKGGIIRGIRTGIAFVLAGVAASIADGSLVHEIRFLPPEYVPFVTLGLTTAFTGVDKWLREKGLVDQAAEDAAKLPLTDNAGNVAALPAVPASVVDVPAPVLNVNDDDPAESVPMTEDAGADVPIDGDSVNPNEFDDPPDSV
jgi:hypothetical protein